MLIGSLLLVGAVVWPLAEALLLAIVLAAVLAPLQRLLAAKLGGRPKLAAGILVFAVLVLLIGPLIGLSAFVIKEAAAGVKFIQETVRGEGVTGLIERLPAHSTGMQTRLWRGSATSARSKRNSAPKARRLHRPLARRWWPPGRCCSRAL